MAKPKINDFRAICEAKAGNVTNIAKAFGVDRKTIYNWMKSPKYQTVYEDVRESLLDFNESQQLLLIRGIPKHEQDDEGNKKMVGWVERPSESMIIWFDKTRGKHRGYTERSEVDHTTNGKDMAAPQLIFSNTQLTDKDLQEIIEIENGVVKKTDDAKEDSENTGISKT